MKQPKAGIRLPSGITLIEHVYRALKDVCREVVLVGHGEGIPEALHSLKRIEDNYKELGPIGGLEALLSSGLDTEYLISPCDLFRVTTDVFSFITSQKNKSIIVLRNKNRIEPLIGIYSSDMLDLVQKHITEGRLSMLELISALDSTTILSIDEKHSVDFSNANSPEDLLIL